TPQTVAGLGATAARAAARRALRLRTNLYAVLVEHDGRVVMRVRVAPVRPHLEMQVRAGLRARTIRVADKLPGLDLLPDLHDSVDMVVPIALAVRVRHKNPGAGTARCPSGRLVAVPNVLHDLTDAARERRVHRRPHSARSRRRNIHASVRGPSQAANVTVKVVSCRAPPLHRADHSDLRSSTLRRNLPSLNVRSVNLKVHFVLTAPI